MCWEARRRAVSAPRRLAPGVTLYVTCLGYLVWNLELSDIALQTHQLLIPYYLWQDNSAFTIQFLQENTDTQSNITMK